MLTQKTKYVVVIARVKIREVVQPLERRCLPAVLYRIAPRRSRMDEELAKKHDSL
jgi:hypothetical protein